MHLGISVPQLPDPKPQFSGASAKPPSLSLVQTKLNWIHPGSAKGMNIHMDILHILQKEWTSIVSDAKTWPLYTRLTEKMNANKSSHIKCAKDPTNEEIWVIQWLLWTFTEQVQDAWWHLIKLCVFLYICLAVFGSLLKHVSWKTVRHVVSNSQEGHRSQPTKGPAAWCLWG